jgi:signal transduction histidine kinase
MALVNVLANALQSMPRGGRLTVDVHPTLDAEQRWLSIAVSDTGPGIPPEVLDRIFEPFVTTRATGTGLGLALAKRILEGHGGAIDVASDPGRGATFTLRLPLAAEPA